MAAGYWTFMDAKAAAQKLADKYGTPIPIYRMGTARSGRKFAVNSGRYGTGRPVTMVKPNR